MFASFYKLGAGGTDKVSAAQEYVSGENTSAGTKRHSPPRHMCGFSPKVLSGIGIDAGAKFKDPATVGSLNFGEIISDEQQNTIGSEFVEFAYAGLDVHDRAYNLFAHEKKLKASGLLSTDIHFCLINQLLSNGRKFTPYFPAADWYGYHLWAERQNYRFDLTSPCDPGRRRLTIPRVFSSDSPQAVGQKLDIGQVIKNAWDNNQLQSKQDVISLLESISFITDVRHTQRGISIKCKDRQKSLLLSAPIYAPDFDANGLRNKIRKQSRKPEAEVEAEYQKIVSLRADRNWKRFGHPVLYSTVKKTSRTDHETIHYQSPLGQSWRALLDTDRQLDDAFLRTRRLCNELSDTVRECRKRHGDYHEPLVSGINGYEGPIAQFKQAADGFKGSDEGVRRMLCKANQSLRKSRRAVGLNRGAVDLFRGFQAAVYRFRRNLTGYPKSCAEVERIIESLHVGTDVSDGALSWFTETGDSLELHSSILTQLKIIDPAGLPELEDLLKWAAPPNPSLAAVDVEREEPNSPEQW